MCSKYHTTGKVDGSIVGISSDIIKELVTVMPGMSQPSVFHLDSDDTDGDDGTEIDADTEADDDSGGDCNSVVSNEPFVNSDLHLLSDDSNSDLHLLSDHE